MKKKLEATAKICAKVARPALMIVPALCAALLVIYMLSDYKKPEETAYRESRSDVVKVKELLARQATVQVADSGNDTVPVAAGTIDKEDGEYQGSANGYGGKITVKVTVKDKKMTAIEILSAPGETEPFFSTAKAVIDSMLAAQSADVDAVSGATYSSRGIIGAVKNALYGTVSDTPLGSANTPTPQGSKDVGTVKESGEYEDGTYEGSGKGFGGTVKVSVTIKGGKIKTIKLLSASGETSSYLSRAKALLKTIVKKQTTNVDAVSGATYSSNGIIQAVRDALSKAEKKKNKKKNKDTTEATTEQNSSTPSATDNFKDGTYKDGTYTGTALGYGGNITVQVTIENGKITQINVTSHSGESKAFYKKAVTLLDTIIKKQTPNVDAVSGATYTSNGLIQAVKIALNRAKTGDSGKDGEETSGDDNTNQTSEDSSSQAGQTTEASESGSSADSTGSSDQSAETTTAQEEGTSEAAETTTEDPYKYNDGSYTISVTCKDVDDDFDDYKMSVTVTIKNDKITAIKVANVSNNSNQDFVNEAKKIISKIVSKGTADGVDAISGATCSSEAIIEACDEAFDRAKK